MDLSSPDVSIGRWTSGSSTNFRYGSVLVVAEQNKDADRIAALLIQSGYSAQCCNDLSSLAVEGQRGGGRSDAYIGTVYCHRRLNASRAAFAIPDELPGKRIVVVSDCDAEQTVISLLENGAHHVFSFEDSAAVLRVRLQAAMRQHAREANRSFSLGDIHFDVQKRQVLRAGLLVELSPKEYDLALYLFTNRERVVCNSELMTSIWSLPATMDTRRIDTAACRLRKKMHLNAGSGWELKRLRRVGYRLLSLASSPVNLSYASA